MGASLSAEEGPFDRVDAIKEQLFEFESRLSSIEQEHQRALRAPASSDLEICGVQLRCRRDVRVQLGPVIGRVTTTEAVVLLETDREADVTAHVCLVDDENVAGGREVGRVVARCGAGAPRAFALPGLLAGERYLVCFAGVHRDDALQCVGEFVTPAASERGTALRVAAVSRDRPGELAPGELDLWKTLAERVASRHLPPLDLMLHLGGQVSLERAFEDAWALLKVRCRELEGRGHRAHARARRAASPEGARSLSRFPSLSPRGRFSLPL